MACILRKLFRGPADITYDQQDQSGQQGEELPDVPAPRSLAVPASHSLDVYIYIDMLYSVFLFGALLVYSSSTVVA